jgi:hypothetical protein
MTAAYDEKRVKGHVVVLEQIEPLRWRVSVDGRPLFTFCSRSRARQAGAFEARRLNMLAADPPGHPRALTDSPASRRAPRYR